MKNPLKKLKTAFLSIQWKTRRKCFVLLEVALMSLFMIGYELVKFVFLGEYSTPQTVVDPSLYGFYMFFMMVLLGVLGLMFVFAGMYFQVYLYERKQKQMWQDMKEKPENIIDLFNNMKESVNNESSNKSD